MRKKDFKKKKKKNLGQKIFFFGVKKIFFYGQKKIFLWAMAHWNYGEMTIKTGGIMPGNYGLWP